MIKNDFLMVNGGIMALSKTTQKLGLMILAIGYLPGCRSSQESLVLSEVTAIENCQFDAETCQWFGRKKSKGLTIHKLSDGAIFFENKITDLIIPNDVVGNGDLRRGSFEASGVATVEIDEKNRAVAVVLDNQSTVLAYFPIEPLEGGYSLVPAEAIGSKFLKRYAKGYEGATFLQDEERLIAVQELAYISQLTEDGRDTSVSLRRSQMSSIRLGTPPEGEDFESGFEFNAGTLQTGQSFESANSGYEGIAHLKLDDGTLLIFALCEGNSCVYKGPEVEQKFSGRVNVFARRAGESTFQFMRKLTLKKRVPFRDYSGIDIHWEKVGDRWEGRVAIVSQEESALWVGSFNFANSYVGVERDLARYKDHIEDGVEREGTRDRVGPSKEGNIYLFDSKYYCNLEGVSWIDDSFLALVSDMPKSNQGRKCREKGQSVHIVDLRQHTTVYSPTSERTTSSTSLTD